jgi:polysaccharide pyruvyl transferase WcaK-like protein
VGIWLIQILLVLASAQEDTDIVIMGERPMVFPEPMQKAEMAIEDILSNESDHMLFLSDDYWPVWLNNSTIA